MLRILAKRIGHRVLAFISRVLNWLALGEWPQTLCARIAYHFGPTCLFCRTVGYFLGPQHCSDEQTWWLLHKHRKSAKNDDWL